MPLFRSLGRMIDAVAPNPMRRARAIWSNLNGVPLDTLGGILRQQMHGHQDHFDGRINHAEAMLEDVRLELCQWLELYQRLDRANRTVVHRTADHAFIVADSLARLDARVREARQPIAVVSVLPPLETGIANYTLRTFEASAVPVDVFAPLDGAAAYLAASRRLPSPSGPLAVFALEALSAALPMRNYAAVVWVLGNSNHHLPVIRLLRETRHLAPLAPTWVQLHDPVLFNLARFHAEEMDSDLASLLRAVVPNGIADADWAAVAEGDIQSIVTHTGLPARALLADVPLTGVIFHSRAARDLVLPDWPELAALEQRLLYLPVMEPFRPRSWRPGPAPRLGTFGYPAASKGTDLVMEAFRRLRTIHPGATLVIAGYNAALYATRNGLSGEPGVEVYDNPPMPKLVELMRGVDVALQLRTHNTGESSGVVPQLLSLDVPTVATAIGAFAEYDDAVRTVPIGCTAEHLLVATLEEAADPACRSEERRRYVETHRGRDFCAALLAAPPAG
jgi:glycosyltransferase involved in cell wall biosynthesis